MKMIDLGELLEKAEADKRKKATDPKHLKDGLNLREDMDSRSGYGKNEEVGKVK